MKYIVQSQKFTFRFLNLSGSKNEISKNGFVTCFCIGVLEKQNRVVYNLFVCFNKTVSWTQSWIFKLEIRDNFLFSIVKACHSLSMYFVLSRRKNSKCNQWNFAANNDKNARDHFGFKPVSGYVGHCSSKQTETKRERRSTGQKWNKFEKLCFFFHIQPFFYS